MALKALWQPAAHLWRRKPIKIAESTSAKIVLSHVTRHIDVCYKYQKYPPKRCKFPQKTISGLKFNRIILYINYIIIIIII